MYKFSVNKLVRDKVPEELKQSGTKVSSYKLSREEYLSCLKDKLIEESEELLEAVNSSENVSLEGVLEELADLIEVVLAIGSYYGLSAIDVDKRRSIKKDKSGIFREGVYVQHVEVPNNHPHLQYYLSKPKKYILQS